MSESDLPKFILDDPFFLPVPDTDWNACIGSQGNEENYIEGYFDAAHLLTGTVIKQRLYGMRDTLILPILFTGRHGVELLLKFIITQLVAQRILQNEHPKNHDVLSHWRYLNDHPLGDKKLTRLINELKPFVVALDKIDADGQQLRYHEDNQGNRSLTKYSIANLRVIKLSLAKLKQLSNDAMNRIRELRLERNTGSFTNECSRSDLLEIAQLLPDYASWNSDQFTKAKANIRKQFELSNRAFGRALIVIKKTRQMRRLIGLETSLGHITDEIARHVLEAWFSYRNNVDRAPQLKHDDSEEELTQNIQGHMERRRVLVETLEGKLHANHFADLETVFYIGRDIGFAEDYEHSLERNCRVYSREERPSVKALHVLSKTNFAANFIEGIDQLGKYRLAQQLRKIWQEYPHYLRLPNQTP